MTRDIDALLQACIAEPAAVGHRLVLSDFLQEQRVPHAHLLQRPGLWQIAYGPLTIDPPRLHWKPKWFDGTEASYVLCGELCFRQIPRCMAWVKWSPGVSFAYECRHRAEIYGFGRWLCLQHCARTANEMQKGVLDDL